MEKTTKRERIQIITLACGQFIKAVRETGNADMSKCLQDAGAKYHFAYKNAAKVVSMLLDMEAIKRRRDGSFALKERVDAKIVSDWAEELCTIKRQRKSQEETKLPEQVDIVYTDDITRFSDEQLVAELRRRGWNVSCQKHIELWLTRNKCGSCNCCLRISMR